jgi:MFS family permease
MSFVNAHFVTYAQDLGYDPITASFGFSIIGATALIGALWLGRLSDKHGRRQWLAFSYQLRALGFLVVLLSMGIPFLGIPSMGISTLVVGVLLVGFSWNSVVGITAAYASDSFGTANLGKIYGTMFAVMPMGSGLGAYLGGLLFDLRGTYDWAILSNIVLLIASALLVWSIGGKRPQALGGPAPAAGGND